MRDWRNVLEWIGRTLIVVGMLVLGFVGFQLWGTSIIEARAQGDLRSDFEKQISQTTPTTRPSATTTSSTAPKPTTTVAQLPAPSGDAIAIIRIPKIDVDRAVVDDITVSSLRSGPGHYPSTPMPGEIGNAGIAGHRTTYGAPFNRLDELAVGDVISVRTKAGTYQYRVSEDPFVVSPREISVLDNTAEPMLTLTTCHPKYSAAQRLVVRARLDTAASATPQPAVARPLLRPSQPEDPEATIRAVNEQGLDGHNVPVLGLLISALIALIIGGAWWYVFHAYASWKTWLAGFALFFPAICWFYYFLERTLPSSY